MNKDNAFNFNWCRKSKVNESLRKIKDNEKIKSKTF